MDVLDPREVEGAPEQGAGRAVQRGAGEAVRDDLLALSESGGHRLCDDPRARRRRTVDRRAEPHDSWRGAGTQATTVTARSSYLTYLAYPTYLFALPVPSRPRTQTRRHASLDVWWLLKQDSHFAVQWFSSRAARRKRRPCQRISTDVSCCKSGGSGVMRCRCRSPATYRACSGGFCRHDRLLRGHRRSEDRPRNDQAAGRCRDLRTCTERIRRAGG